MSPFAQLRCLCVIWICHILQWPMKSFGKCKILLPAFLSSSGWTVRATDRAILAIICNYITHYNHLIGHSYFQLAQSKVKTNYVQLEWFLCQKTKKCGCVKYFLVLCPKTQKMCLCQIFSSFVSENWGRSNYKPDWQNQVIAAQYQVPNQFITVAINY